MAITVQVAVLNPHTNSTCPFALAALTPHNVQQERTRLAGWLTGGVVRGGGRSALAVAFSLSARGRELLMIGKICISAACMAPLAWEEEWRG
jgi:hypothetical protein